MKMSVYAFINQQTQNCERGEGLPCVCRGSEEVEIDDVDFPLVGFCFVSKRKFIRSTSFLLAPHTRFIDGHSNFVPDMRVRIYCLCVRTCILGLVAVKVAAYNWTDNIFEIYIRKAETIQSNNDVDR